MSELMSELGFLGLKDYRIKRFRVLRFHGCSLEGFSDWSASWLMVAEFGQQKSHKITKTPNYTKRYQIISYDVNTILKS
jgi:hypothetical protein